MYDSAGLLPAPALSASSDWTEDATRDHYNDAFELKWKAQLGNWTDAAGTERGNAAFASAQLPDTDSERPVEWDVTELVRKHGAEFMIRRSGGTDAKFRSREADEESQRPQLIVTKGGATTTLFATADVWLSGSTYKTQGASKSLSSTGPLLLRFNVGPDAGITKATLRLTSYEQYGPQRLDIFRPDASPNYPAPLSVSVGTAADALLTLTGQAWRTTANSSFRTDRMTINADGSLTVSIPTGSDTGSSAVYGIPAAVRASTMFARTVMKVHGDWDATMGGKYPGLANTGQGDKRSSQCGWGGRLANGTCWSARTNRHPFVAGTPFAATHQGLSNYVYRVNRTTSNGEGTSFALPIPKERYFVLDQMVKLNSIAADGTPSADGEVAYWLDGVLVNRFTGLILRDNASDATLPSEYWLDVYEGGTGYLAPHPHTVTFKEVTVSTRLLPFDKGLLDRLNL